MTCFLKNVKVFYKISCLTAFLMFLSMSPRSAGAFTIDFDTDAAGNTITAGQIFDDEYSSWGLNITADNYHPDANHPNMAMAFNSASPTGGDSDLAASDLGMIMILSEDGDSSDPDDEGSRPAGVINFNFNFYLNSGSMSFLDIEEDSHELRLYDTDTLLHTYILDPTENNGRRTQDFSGFDFNRIEVYFAGSGAITGLEVNPVPEPATMMLFGLGLLGLARLGRKK